MGNASIISNRKRHITLETMSPLLEVNGVRFISLQLGTGAEQLRATRGAKPITDLTQEVKDFADSAALMAELDLIISVDTATAHLAGALGRHAWTLLAFTPDWRWGLGRDDTPWYPTMRLFRQPTPGDWDSVIGRVKRELAELVASLNRDS